MKVLDRMITMYRGWIAIYSDGRVFCEEDMPWKKLPSKKEIVCVLLKWDDRFWSLDNKQHYMAPSRREMVVIGAGGISAPMTQSRAIGYYDMETKERVVLRVDEATGRMSYETTPFEE